MVLFGLLQAAWSSRTLRRSFVTLVIVGIAGNQIIKYVDKKNDAAVDEFRRGQDAIIRQMTVENQQNTERHEAVMGAIGSLQGTVKTLDDRVYRLAHEQKLVETHSGGGGRQSARLEAFPQE